MRFYTGNLDILIILRYFLFKAYVWFLLMSGSPAALFRSSCSRHQDYHKRGTSVKPALICTQVRPINLKVVIKRHELLLFFYRNLLEKREAFQFHSLQNTQVFIALYFLLSTSLREAGLMTSMYAAPIHNAIQPSDMCCKWSLNTIKSLLLACTVMGSTVQSHSAIWQFCSHEKSPSAALCARKGPIFYNIAKFLCYSQKRLGIKLKSQQICDRWGIFYWFLANRH